MLNSDDRWASGPSYETVLNPWRTIWTHPRMTVHWVAKNEPMDWLWILAIMGGTSQVLGRVSEIPLAPGIDAQALFSLALIAGPLAGLILVFGYGRILHIVLRRLGGAADWVGSRTAIVWSLAPSLPSLALWGIMIATYGFEVLSSKALGAAAHSGRSMMLEIDFFVQFCLIMWSLFIEVISLASLHRVSAWRVLLVEIGLRLALVIVLLGLFALLAA